MAQQPARFTCSLIQGARVGPVRTKQVFGKILLHSAAKQSCFTMRVDPSHLINAHQKAESKSPAPEKEGPSLERNETALQPRAMLPFFWVSPSA